MTIKKIRRDLVWSLVAALVTMSAPLFAGYEAGTTRIGIMLFDGVLTSDIVAPMEVFGGAIASGEVENYEVITVGREAGTVTTQEGGTSTAEYSIDNGAQLGRLIDGSS